MMPDAETKDMSAFEFDIACEWAGCEQPAVVLGRGCIDSRHVAVCEGHHRWIRDLFDTIPPFIVCAVCGVPMLVFEQHFDIVDLS